MSPKPFDKAQGKRVLIFSLAYYPVEGGAEIAVKEITDRISDIEFDVITMCFSPTHLEKEKIGNCTIYRISGGLGYLSKILFVPHAALFALKLNRTRKYEALWAIMTYMTFPVVLMRLLGNRTPYIITLQDGDPFAHVFNRPRILIFKPLLLYGFRHADKVQVISNYLAKWAKMMKTKREIALIPNGVNFGKFSTHAQHPLDNEGSQTSLITTSRLVEKNGVEDIIDALEFLPVNVKLKILGTGILESKLKQKTKDRRLEARVEFLGHISNDQLPKYLHEADIFVRPSLSEGQGISFIEAMAAGLPVIATNVGGIPDFLRDRETGLFCKVNDPKSIADKVMEYVNNPKLVTKIVENARKMVEEKYDWDLIAKRMKEEIFDKV